MLRGLKQITHKGHSWTILKSHSLRAKNLWQHTSTEAFSVPGNWCGTSLTATKTKRMHHQSPIMSAVGQIDAERFDSQEQTDPAGIVCRAMGIPMAANEAVLDALRRAARLFFENEIHQLYRMK